MKDAKSVVGFVVPANFESDGMTSHYKHGMAAGQDSFKMSASEVASFETNFFRISGIQRLKVQ